ncbi:DNA-directed RNA polymerase III subunit RPC6 [Auxenochlorella protothecoides]|uniref:DNA-directed RNA polymerase III subunit RPC6 n=1 Tax=Auxenochlorella protothecoides TaxID=3075 RepID=A0A087SSG1_AUXPR|nr:DNA-directed RNA polymerase III subunit RPC6 [Auxenochlorella protothecoides]KFM28665.1 DNA-directed RNA polymerase III subunit RPC6 [Auxenochlorella protothecoides]RMZ55508.1 hypothetical protein APUTEX25_000091 [Auxenochlorella protothecoides]|eukprot:RMZ55508.1 hypothetical protein APUTEX25_000091 [Auxenochlorella protothecoides]
MEARAQAINSLLRTHRLQILMAATGGGHVYKMVQKEDAIKLKGLSTEDHLLYQCIARAGNVGIWTKDMKRRTNLSQPRINKIVKFLEEKGMIKFVKSVQNASRKMYMLSELEPAKEITGGPWYGDDGKLDASFIVEMQGAVMSFIRHQRVCTAIEVLEFVEENKICTLSTPLQPDDMALLLNNLVYDGQLESKEDEEGALLYRPALHHGLESTPLTACPCGVCPIIHDCVEEGPISPSTCNYYREWLDF